MDYKLLRAETGPTPKGRTYKKLYVCSPLNAPSRRIKRRNMLKAREYMRQVSQILHCSAVAPHAYISLLLDDAIPAERELALEFGLRLLELCDGLVVCSKIISSGMRSEVAKARELGLPILFLEDLQHDMLI